MKCRFIVLPVWKKPAAKGAWYQVLSKPVIPVERRVLAPAAKWMRAAAAIARAIRVGTRELRPAGPVVAASPTVLGASPLRAAGDPRPHATRGRSVHRPTPRAQTRARYGTGSRAPKEPR